jgi:hypothetical protein
VWLDGDWCWAMNPFIVNQENKNMVEDNITYLLRNFLTNSSFDYVLFSWVIHSEEIFSQLLERLSDLRFRVVKISLISTEAALKERLLRDLKLNLRDEGTIETSLNRLQLYQSMNTNKIDTTNLSVAETADKIIGIIHKEQM